MPSFDLLSEPIVTVRGADGEQMLSLPALLASLSADDDAVATFPALQPHQKHAWFAFLVQLAALVRSRVDDPKTNEAKWRASLITLAGHPSAFCLVEPDLDKPAFLQPPVNGRDLKALRLMPDKLDILLTTKSHDLKGSRFIDPTPEHWLFALLNLQTMQGFSGRANYGIARMNGGFSNRPGVGRTLGPKFGPRFRRDVALLLRERKNIISDFGYSQTGHALLWIPSWKDDSPLNLKTCDPFFIEICRRVRLSQDKGILSAKTGPSQKARVESSTRKGVLGDPWTPIVPGDEPKALTIDGNGIGWRQLHRFLFSDDLTPSVAQEQWDEDPERTWLTVWAFVRGQGKTEGLHQRWLEIPPRVTRRRRKTEGWRVLAKRAKDRVTQVDKMKFKVLAPALLRLVVDPGEKALRSNHTGHLKRFEPRFEAWVEREFFSCLWRDMDKGSEERDQAWINALKEAAHTIFKEACQETSFPKRRRYLRLENSSAAFYGCLRKQFPETLPSSTEGSIDQ